MNLALRFVVRPVAHHAPLVRDDADVPPVDAGVAGEKRAPIALLVLGPRPFVDEARQDLAGLVLLVALVGVEAVDLLRRIRRVGGRVAREAKPALRTQVAHDVAQRVDGLLVVCALVVGDARNFGVRHRAAQHVALHVLTDGGLHEVRPREVDRAGALHDQRLVAHNRQVSAAGHAAAHDGGNLRDALARQLRVVAEDASEVLLVRKDLVLHRQVDARRVHEVEDRDVVFQGDLLGAQVLLRGDRKPRAGLHGGVVGDDHAEAARDVPQAHHGTACGAAALLLVHLVAGKQAELLEVVRGVHERFDALARGHLAALVLPLDSLLAAAFADLRRTLAHRLHKGFVMSHARLEGGVGRGGVGAEGCVGHGGRGWSAERESGAGRQAAVLLKVALPRRDPKQDSVEIKSPAPNVEAGR